MIKETLTTVKSNPIGLVLGAGAGFLIAKKAAKLEKTWQLVASAVVGGILGAMGQSKLAAKKAGKVTVTEVKK